MYTGEETTQNNLYGSGFSYTFLLDSLSIDRLNVEDRISNHEFSHVIFSVSHHGRHPLVDLVRQNVLSQNIFFFDGSDTAETDSYFADVCRHVGTCFRRELSCNM